MPLRVSHEPAQAGAGRSRTRVIASLQKPGLLGAACVRGCVEASAAADIAAERRVRRCDLVMDGGNAHVGSVWPLYVQSALALMVSEAIKLNLLMSMAAVC